MAGTITKKHFFLIWREFGFRTALHVLFSREPVALLALMGIK